MSDGKDGIGEKPGEGNTYKGLITKAEMDGDTYTPKQVQELLNECIGERTNIWVQAAKSSLSSKQYNKFIGEAKRRFKAQLDK